MQCLNLPLHPFTHASPLPSWHFRMLPSHRLSAPFLLALPSLKPPPPPPTHPPLQPPAPESTPMLQAVSAMLPPSKCIPAGFRERVAHCSSTAYVQMALHGSSLRRSLRAASQLLQRHRRRMRNCQGAAHAAVLPGKVCTTPLAGL